MKRMAHALGLLLLIGMIGAADLEFGQRRTAPGVYTLVTSAEAAVGRPATPVSVAGVARRTARRCAAGVYDC
jgi:hypothetical protein